MSDDRQWLTWICAANDTDELRDRYDAWSDRYEADVVPEWGHILDGAVELLSRLIGDPTAAVLDAGAGTGLAGVGLAARGLRHIVGVDLSPGMLRHADRRGVYAELHAGSFADEVPLGPERRFAGVLCAGVFAEGHCGPEHLPPLVRRLEPGGILVFTARPALMARLEAVLADRPGHLLHRTRTAIYGDGTVMVTCAWQAGHAGRYAAIGHRDDRSDLPEAAWRPITERFSDTRWRGVALDKSPFELALLPQLLFEQGIESVIELGTGAGGSALWLADHLALYGRRGAVLTVDDDPEALDPRLPAHPSIRAITGDCNRIAEALPAALLDELPHPWLVIEDAHSNVGGVLEHLEQHGLTGGDYVLIEDTNEAMWDAWRDWPDTAYIERCRAKLGDVRRWLAGRPGRYLVDTWYQDLFGYNASKTWNTLFRVVPPSTSTGRAGPTGARREN